MKEGKKSGKKKYDSDTSEPEKPQPVKTLKSKLSTFKIRVISSVIMILSFLLILTAGHFYCCLLVLLINIFIFKEIIALKRNEQREAKLPCFSLINWYFFAVTELIMTSAFVQQKIVKVHMIEVIFT